MSEVSRVPDPAGVNVCRSAPAPGICDQHGVDFGECADEHPPEVSRVQEPGWKTLPVVWPESAIHGAVERAREVVAGKPGAPDGAVAGIATMDLACLVDVATTFLAGETDVQSSTGARPAADYATAYASLHEVVRAFLAGERNTRYLRRLHAEIEADLTGGEDHG